MYIWLINDYDIKGPLIGQVADISDFHKKCI